MDEELNTMQSFWWLIPCPLIWKCVCAHQSWEDLTLQQGKAAKCNSRCATPNPHGIHMSKPFEVY